MSIEEYTSSARHYMLATCLNIPGIMIPRPAVYYLQTVNGKFIAYVPNRGPPPTQGQINNFRPIVKPPQSLIRYKAYAKHEPEHPQTSNMCACTAIPLKGMPDSYLSTIWLDITKECQAVIQGDFTNTYPKDIVRESVNAMIWRHKLYDREHNYYDEHQSPRVARMVQPPPAFPYIRETKC